MTEGWKPTFWDYAKQNIATLFLIIIFFIVGMSVHLSTIENRCNAFIKNQFELSYNNTCYRQCIGINEPIYPFNISLS